MPLKKGKGHMSQNIRELHQGPQYAKTKSKHGKAVADKQAVAIAYAQERKGGGKSRKQENRNRRMGEHLMRMM